jgi:dUTP pyrophosphatase
MKNLNIKIVNSSNNELPEYATVRSAGMDLKAFLLESILLKPGDINLVPTGLFFEIPDGYEVQIRPRSGLAYKNGVTVLNSPGTIDSDYRGEIKIILINLGKEDFVINSGDRIAQMIVSKYEHNNWIEVNELNDSLRGSGGFGHTGK